MLKQLSGQASIAGTRILFCVPGVDEDSGGPSRSVMHTGSELLKFGADVSVLFFESGKKHYQLHQSNAAHPTMYSITQSIGLLNAIRAIFEDFKPDIVHVHGIWTWLNHLCCLESFRREIPYIISPRGMLEPWSLEQKKWKKRLGLWMYQSRDLERASVIHCTSELEQKNLQSFNSRLSSFVVPNGTTIPVLTDSLITDSLRPKTIKRLLFLSRLHPKKGIPLLLEAWNAIRPSGWECIICGPDCDGHRRVIERMIASLGLSDSCKVIDAVEGEEKANLFRSADLFILPSHSESFGNVVAEAMSYGIPVITTTATPWSVLNEERCGWCVDGDGKSITLALRTAIQLPSDQLRAIGLRGHEIAKKQFSWSSSAEDLALAYLTNNVSK